MTTATPTTNTQYGFCFHPDLGRDDCSGRLRLWVDHRSETRFIPTLYDIRREEWDAVQGRIILSAPLANGSGSQEESRCECLTRYAAGMERDLRLVGDIVHEFERSGRDFSSDDIVDVFKDGVPDKYTVMALPLSQL